MHKIAQKRSILNKLREKTNIGGIAAEKFFNPEFERVMESLRSADNKIRSIASGTDIDGEGAGEDPISLKELLKSAKSNLNRREYMTSLAFLGRFHKKVENIVKFIEQLGFDVDKVHHDFLFRDLDDEQKKHLHEMKSRFASSSKTSLVAEANIIDFLSNIGTERGRALAAWEKRYPKQVKKIKADTQSLLNKSEVMLNHILSSLKEMATSRATRKIDDYMKSAQKITSYYTNYDSSFRNYYSSNIKSFLDKQEFLNPTKKVEESAELGGQEINVEDESISSTMPAESSDFVYNKEPHSSNVPIPLVQRIEENPITPDAMYEALKAPKTPVIHQNFDELEEVEGPVTLPSPPSGMETEDESVIEKRPEIPPTAAHKRFFDSLVSFANESPYVISMYISRYAKSIQSSDPKTAIELFNIVRTIKQG